MVHLNRSSIVSADMDREPTVCPEPDQCEWRPLECQVGTAQPATWREELGSTCGLFFFF